MKHFPKIIALFLIGLFLLFSFNAQACLIPIFSSQEVPSNSDCSMPGEEPASQFCEGFKTLAVQGGSDAPSSGYAQASLMEEISSHLPACVCSPTFLFNARHLRVAVEKDILLRISVFRI